MRSTRTTILLTLPALALAACSADAGGDPFEPRSAFSTAEPAAAAYRPALPFHGTVEASETHNVSADGHFLGHVVGTGTAAVLGRFTLDDDQVGSFATLTADVTIVMTAANGDVLTATGSAQATPSADFLSLTLVETATITGGTGRFAGATGSFIMERVVDIAAESPYPSAGSFTGSITLAH